MNRRHMLSAVAAAAALPVILSSTASIAQVAKAAGDAEKKHADEAKNVGSLSLATSRQRPATPVQKATLEMIQRIVPSVVAHR